MIDFKEYDQSIEIYTKSNRLKTMPLVSWDIYAQTFSKVSNTLQDSSKLRLLSNHQNWMNDLNLKDELLKDTVIVVTDTKLNIVFASHNLMKLNGYRPEEVLGQSPKIFQGKETCQETSREIREAILAQKPFDKIVTNYCKDGSIYKCQIKGYPVFDHKGILQNFIALERIAS